MKKKNEEKLKEKDLNERIEINKAYEELKEKEKMKKN